MDKISNPRRNLISVITPPEFPSNCNLLQSSSLQNARSTAIPSIHREPQIVVLLLKSPCQCPPAKVVAIIFFSRLYSLCPQRGAFLQAPLIFFFPLSRQVNDSRYRGCQHLHRLRTLVSLSVLYMDQQWP